MLSRIYGLISAFVFIALFPLLLPIALLKPKYRYRLAERFGHYNKLFRQDSRQRLTVWIHASSVGEVQAARALIDELGRQNFPARFVVSVMTEQGYRVARHHFTDKITVLLAPLDVGFIVQRSLRQIKPDIYICLETELWPAMLLACRSAGVTMALLNGRLSERSLRSYRRFLWLMRPVVRSFSEIGVITQRDKERFQHLGVDSKRLQVTGNSKYDLVPAGDEAVREHYLRFFRLAKEKKVFICGSTRSGEEKLLLATYQYLRDQEPENFLLIIAPRHLERLPIVEKLLKEKRLKFDRFSAVKERGRRQDIVLVDTMGELSQLYSIGDYIFCGGSLVERGGHNVMEAAIWGKPVYYGPYMKDFRDATELLEAGGAGFPVKSEKELAEKILYHIHTPAEYIRACQNARTVTMDQHGAAKRQADIILKLRPLEKLR